MQDAAITSGRAGRCVVGAWFSATESTYKPGQRIGLHAHRNPDLTIVRGGAFDSGTRMRRHTCHRGRVLFLPGGQEHCDRFADVPTTVLIIEIRGPRWEGLGRRCRPPGDSCVLDSPLVARSAELLEGSFAEGGAALEEHALELVAALVRFEERHGRFARPRWLGEAVEMLRTSFHTRVGLGQVADAVGVHPIHLARVFRCHLGCSVGDYVEHLRIDRAATALVRTDQPIHRIALDSGFYDHAQFARVFKRRMGTSPVRFRAESGTTRSHTRASKIQVIGAT